MSAPRPPRIPPEIRAVLDQSGLSWEIQHGSKHHQIRVEGRLAGILGRGKASTASKTTIRNSVAQIRRLCAEIAKERK